MTCPRSAAADSTMRISKKSLTSLREWVSPITRTASTSPNLAAISRSDRHPHSCESRRAQNHQPASDTAGATETARICTLASTPEHGSGSGGEHAACGWGETWLGKHSSQPSTGSSTNHSAGTPFERMRSGISMRAPAQQPALPHHQGHTACTRACGRAPAGARRGGAGGGGCAAPGAPVPLLGLSLPLPGRRFAGMPAAAGRPQPSPRRHGSFSSRPIEPRSCAHGLGISKSGLPGPIRVPLETVSRRASW